MISAAALKSVRDRIERARSRTGRANEPPIEIIAVTKAFPPETIIRAYKSGVRSIGENRVQEAMVKFKEVPDLPGLKRRLIGHLQSNKARKAVNLFDTIDSVDSVKLGRKLSSIAKETGKEIPTLIQVNTADDPAKYGFDSSQTEEILKVINLEGLRAEGLMTIGTLTQDKSITRETFKGLWDLRDELNDQLPREKQLIHLSMGMSGDYEIAVEEGATMLRLGTVLFGPRPEPPNKC